MSTRSKALFPAPDASGSGRYSIVRSEPVQRAAAGSASGEPVDEGSGVAVTVTVTVGVGVAAGVGEDVGVAVAVGVGSGVRADGAPPLPAQPERTRTSAAAASAEAPVRCENVLMSAVCHRPDRTAPRIREHARRSRTGRRRTGAAGVRRCPLLAPAARGRR
ncbi:hypothetical protein C5C32_05700 [Rathayibacter sp. AY1G9]|nr:hypothetical protein C5C32_05700 [Rathayibacter sp. AY1G9]